ncbi:MAG: transporter substrate-binding domain-containing protein [Clostridia bacterium]|nr:transporter substrate-binding domain-containing protein [Clostridia bacterium]
MRKFIRLMLTALLAISVAVGATACAVPGGETGDLAAVQAADKLVVGVTIYEPMDYIDDEGEWTGFDAELAKMFAEELGVNCQIVIITWGQKVAELDSKQIDLVWNGMTASEDLGKEIDFSVSYAKNAQVAVVKADSNITTKDQIKAARVAVEDGSAGQTQAVENGMTTINPVAAQVDALNEVTAGTSDVAIIDITMAQSVVGKGDYADLKIVDGVSYGDEVFAVGLRKGSDLKAKLDAFLKEKYADGTMAALAEKYSVGINTEALGAE